jgi:xanthine/CO dehydrogenase XdhC/CoxF family maturation factor
MKELNAILTAWRGLNPAERDAVLATVVHVTGSAYRRPGARMLIVPGGRRFGCVSGGCLEGEIIRKAWWFTESGEPVVRVYDTTSEDGATWEFGLGCNGVVHVLLERANSPGASGLLGFLDERRNTRTPAVVATVIRAGADATVRVGARLLVGGSYSLPAGSLSGSAVEPRILPHVAAVFHEKQSRLAHVGAIDVFVEWIAPPLSLVVLGAGHDAIPLVNFAAQLGWNVTVADGRPAYSQPERFPDADVVGMPAADFLRHVHIDSETFVVMMTHNYPLDSLLLPRILAIRPRYLGLLGPKARAERLFSEQSLHQPAFVHAPAGLDAGCDSPEAIALSIVAEIQAERNSRAGGKLKHRDKPIHVATREVGVAERPLNADALRPSWCEAAEGNHV